MQTRCLVTRIQQSTPQRDPFASLNDFQVKMNQKVRFKARTDKISSFCFILSPQHNYMHKPSNRAHTFEVFHQMRSGSHLEQDNTKEQNGKRQTFCAPLCFWKILKKKANKGESISLFFCESCFGL
jgi:hypothetical protein